MTALHLEALRVRRMPGIDDGGYELTGLAPGLTIVHGPNASGKTTTARAVQAVFWPRAAAEERPWVTAVMRAAGSRWTATVHGRAVHWQRDGVDAEALVVPADEARDRYRLSLHELLLEDDEGIAGAIGRESAGGYDLAAAADAIGASGTVPRTLRELRDLEDAKAALDEAVRAQEALRGEERRLRVLQEELAGRDPLRAYLRVLEAAIDHARARDEAARAAVPLAAFDPRMERLSGDEADRLRELESRIAAARERANQAEADLRAAEETLRDCRLPEAGLPAGLLAALRADLDDARDAEREAAGLEEARSEAEARRARALAALGPDATPERLRRVGREEVAAVAAFTREVSALERRREALEAQLDAIADEPAGASVVADPDLLEDAVRALREWLRAGSTGADETRRLRRLVFAAAALLIACGLALAVAHIAFTLLALAGVALVLLTVTRPAAADGRAAARAAFQRTALPGPAEWQPSSVEVRLDELERELRSARAALATAERRRAIEAAIARLGTEMREFDGRRRSITDQYGLSAGSEDGSILWLIDRLGDWYDADAAVAAGAARIGAAREQLEARIRTAAGRAGELVDGEILDVNALAGVIDDLDRRDRAHREAIAARTASLRTMEEQRADAGAASTARAELLGRVEAEEAERPRIDGWCAELAAYRAAREAQRTARAAATAARERLDRAINSVELAGGLTGPELIDAPEDVIAGELERASERLARLDEISDEASGIRARIDDAKRAHGIEDALARVDRCEQALREARERNVESAIAAVLVEHVQAATRDRHRPHVFRRAREIFTRITHGRYRLDLHDGEPPAFRALDNTTGVGHRLEELSSATRIQLLLAVRLAFVETREQGVALPILFDETLGNSDDARAAAIMEALVELAAAGRQVFYFTAQPDEVAKWRGVLAARGDVPHAVIDLARARGLTRPASLPGLEPIPLPAPAVPAPGEMDHEAYGRALSVPAIDLFDGARSAHLWYFVEDSRTLYRILAELRVERWGALEALLSTDSPHGLVDAGVLARAKALAAALDAALELLRVGRGRPVDRAALEASGAVSDTFMAPLVELCARCEGDARRILDALAARVVTGFWRSKRDDLAAHLADNGYLDDREPASPQAVRIRALAAAGHAIDAGLLTTADVDRLLARAGATRTEAPRTIAPRAEAR